MKRLLLVIGMVGCGGGDVATPLPDPIENSIGIVLVPLPAGEFQMGSPATESGRQLVGGAAPSASAHTVPSWRARGSRAANLAHVVLHSDAEDSARFKNVRIAATREAPVKA